MLRGPYTTFIELSDFQLISVNYLLNADPATKLDYKISEIFITQEVWNFALSKNQDSSFWAETNLWGLLNIRLQRKYKEKHGIDFSKYKRVSGPNEPIRYVLNI